MKLPLPIGRQKEVLCLPGTGHFVVLGTAGSGKTTLAILRSAFLADPNTDHHGKTLLVTFNRALVAYLKHLRGSTLSDVVVENYHTFARGYLACRGKLAQNSILSDLTRKQELIAEALNHIARNGEPDSATLDLPIEFLVDEFRWIAQHGIKDSTKYFSAPRTGRRGRIEKKIRKKIFEVYETYLALRGTAGKLYDWDDLATAAASEFDKDTSERRYRHIVIDEGQDFSPEMIRSLVKAVPSDGSVTFFGDFAQQIYGQQTSWKSAGLKISKVWEFKENYRNSKQIAKLGLAVSKMPFFKEIPDLVEPVSPVAEGPLPTLVEFRSQSDEVGFVVDQAVKAAKTQSVAILFRDRSDEKLVGDFLPAGAVRLHRDMTTWQAGPGIRYGTYHSAKGLEFDLVLMPFCSEENLPELGWIEAFGLDEAMTHDGHLLYVGVTRAKRGLLITHCDKATQLLPADAQFYEKLKR